MGKCTPPQCAEKVARVRIDDGSRSYYATLTNPFPIGSGKTIAIKSVGKYISDVPLTQGKAYMLMLLWNPTTVDRMVMSID